jgi:acyl-CoA synthetase (AMP-forming)/AMP-acid ligase II
VAGWNFAAVWAAIARVVPDREAIICSDRTVTWRDFDQRAAALATWLRSQGVTPGDRVAIDCTNTPEYLETFFAALKLGAAPVNVNYRYLADEVRYVLTDSGARVVVVAPEFADGVAGAVAPLPATSRPVTLQLGPPYETTIAANRDAPDPAEDRTPDSDDLILLYTGGTTGLPKGVMWRNDDLYVALWDMARPGTEPRDPAAAARAGKRAATALPACPLMHGTGLFAALGALSGAGTVVLVPGVGLDPIRIWSEVERHRVAVLVIVGDVFARPLFAALDAEPDRFDLSCLRVINSSGVTFSPDAKAGLLRHLPHVRLLDSLGSSEGLITRSETGVGDAIEPARFSVSDRMTVLDEDTLMPVVPGSGAAGLLAVTGRIPLGYWGDGAKSAATFRVAADGRRYAVPGDYATIEADGTIRLLGRGSACINTGGEKVYPEEVESVLLAHPAIEDCVVFGIPDDRYGEIVVAVISPRLPDDSGLRQWVRERLAGYKQPRRFVMLDALPRNPAGKADYRVLRELAIEEAGR